MRKYFVSIFVALVVTLHMDCVYGWGRDGHREVARIAFRRTTNKGRKFLKAHEIDSLEAFAEASLWADTEAAIVAYPGSDELHFSNTPWRNCQPFVFDRDCGYDGSGACIVSGIASAVSRAIDASLNKTIRTDAIKFLSHLIADIHQPLHTGFAEDRGGAQIKLRIDDSTISLHELWDYGLLERLRGEGAESVVPSDPEIPVKLTPENLETKILDYASALATESSTMFTCRSAYQFDDGQYITDRSVVTEEYLTSRSRIASMRLRTAARRLAELLDLMANAVPVSQPVVHGGAGGAGRVTKSTNTDARTGENYFAVLAMDFNPEEIVVNQTRNDLSRHVSGERPTAGSHLVAGRNLTDVTMVKMGGRYIITCHELLRSSPDYEPVMVAGIRVKFSRTRSDPVLFLVDSSCFSVSRKDFTVKELTQILLHLKGLNNDADLSEYIDEHYRDGGMMEPTSRHDMTSGSNFLKKLVHGPKPIAAAVPADASEEHLQFVYERHRAQFNAQFFGLSAGGFKTLQEKWLSECLEAAPDIYVAFEGNIQMLLHKSTILNHTNPHMKFGVLQALDPRDDKSFTLLVDSNIYDGYISADIVAFMRRLTRDANKKAMLPFVTQRVTLFDEMKNLEQLLAIRAGKRPRTIDIRMIENFCMYQGHPMLSDYFIIEYSLSRAYLEGKIVPALTKARGGHR